jgi:PAS domain S-box-containing protein
MFYSLIFVSINALLETVPTRYTKRVMTDTYDLQLVVFSIAIAVIASYTALALAGRVTTSHKYVRTGWLISGAIAMGTGIWSMHFIGMLAFCLPVSVTYDVPLMVLSLLDAIIASGAALFWVSRPILNPLQLLSGGIFMGLAIASMHYLGMAAMQLQATIQYNLVVVVVSVAIAIGASCVALWLTFKHREQTITIINWSKLGSAMLMGAAISGMHYTGMMAASFTPTPHLETAPSPILDAQRLATTIGITTLIILSLTLLASAFDQRTTFQALKEQALQESEKRFRTLIREMQVGVLLLGPQAEVILHNQAALTLLGLTEHQLLSDSAFGSQWKVIQENTTAFPSQNRPVQKAIATRQLVRNVVMGVYKPTDQDWVWLLVNADPQLAADGSVEQVICTFSDISERKRTEEALLQSETKFRTFVENANDIIYSLTTEGIFSYVAPNWTELLGHDVSEVEGKPFSNFIHPENQPACIEFFHKIVITGEKQSGVEYQIKHKDGSWRWHTTSGSASKDTNGNILCFIGVCRDITSAKQVEAEIHIALAKEKELGELKSRFISMTSHEFRTPLSTILFSAELLEAYSQNWTNEKKNEHLHRIQSAVDRMTQLLDDVLLLGKAEAGKLECKPIPLNLEKFCIDLVEEVRLGAGSKYTITLAKQGQYTTTYIDEKLLRQILGNLLSNALKYSHQGSTIDFEVYCQDGEAIFKIKDQGIGIPLEDQQRLFESFHRADNVGTIPGTGLGLAIVKKAVDIHNGKITVDSQLGVGTTFTVTLPVNN